MFFSIFVLQILKLCYNKYNRRIEEIGRCFLMDKKNINFFSFVYKIIRFLFLLPINIIKYFCIGFYFVNYIIVEIVLYTVIFISFGFYKIVKYFVLFFGFPTTIYNILRRCKSMSNTENLNQTIAQEVDDKIFSDNEEIILIDEPTNTITDNNYDIIDIDDLIAQDEAKQELLGTDNHNDLEAIFAEKMQQPDFIKLEPQILAIPEEEAVITETSEVIEEPIQAESYIEKKVRPNYLLMGFKKVVSAFCSIVMSISYPVYKLFKYLFFGLGATVLAVKDGIVYTALGLYKIVRYLIFGIAATLLFIWKSILYISYIVYLPFKYCWCGISYVLLCLKQAFVYISFIVYKTIKYLVLSFTLPLMIVNTIKRHYDDNSEIREEARLRKQEEKFKKQLLRQKKQEDKLRASLEKRKENEYINENVKIEKKSLGQQFNDLLNTIFSLPSTIVTKVKKAFHDSVFAKDSRNKRDMSRQALLLDFEGEDAEKSDVKLVYQYTAKNAEGKIITDYFEAFSKVEVHSFLLSEGYEVYNIKTNRWIQLMHSGASTSKAKVKTKDLIFFLNQLSTYIKAGIPLVESLKILARQYSKQKKYQKLFRTLIYDLSMGESFSSALGKQGDAFPRILINMVKASEMTGELPEVLDDMAEYFTEMDKTRKQMVTALMYPIIILVVSVAVITFILLFVIPRFVSIYESMDAAQIPGFTLAILAISEFLQSNFAYLLIGILLVVIIIIYLYKNVKVFRTLCQWLMMHMPVFGNVIIYNEVTTFTKTFASLLAHNVFITDSMEILNRVTNNEIYKMLILDTITNLAKGEKISTSFKDHWAFPVPAYEMLVTGERTGQLPEMMSKVSAYYQELHRNSVTRIKTFIEPILILFLTVVVGVIVLAIVVPMFGLYESVQSYG